VKNGTKVTFIPIQTEPSEITGFICLFFKHIHIHQNRYANDRFVCILWARYGHCNKIWIAWQTIL